ncbi:MAG: hypothetical protein IPO04_14430 [Cytophagaceae bacterium]|nr:hypothetical protein [Cytophagaceae bacterium]
MVSNHKRYKWVWPDSYYRIRVRSTLPVATGSFSPIGLGIGGGAPTVKILGSTNITTPGTSTPLTLVLSSVSGTTNVTINNGTSTEVWTAGALKLPFYEPYLNHYIHHYGYCQ